MPASLKNILIGLFVLIAGMIIVFMLLFLHPNVGDNAKTLKVRFPDIDKVNVGTRVTFAGRPVGEVVSIRELPEARTGRVSLNGDIYVYELELKVDSGVDVFNSDNILLRTSGLLGERNVEINPQPLKPNQELKLVDNEIIYATQTGSVESTLKIFAEISEKVAVVLDDFHNAMEELKKAKTFEKIAHTVQNVDDITTALNQPEKWQKSLDNVVNLTNRANETWTTVDSFLSHIHQISQDVKKSWGTVDHALANFDQLSVRAHQSWTTIDEALANFNQLSARAQQSWTTVDQALHEFRATGISAHAVADKANQIMDYTRQGRGSIGQLFMGDDLYLRLKSIFHKGETVINDINAYGLLYTQNKGWQRLQGRRLKLLEKLSNPCEFVLYFRNEMDQINSSLSRVSVLLNESTCSPESLIYNPDFTKRFAELLRRTENMEETLKLYNEQIIE